MDFPQEIIYQIPLYDEDYHFQFYRSLQMESAIIRLEELLMKSSLDNSIKISVEKEIKIIKFNLGMSLDNN